MDFDIDEDEALVGNMSVLVLTVVIDGLGKQQVKGKDLKLQTEGRVVHGER